MVEKRENLNTKEYVVNARNGDEHAIRQLMDSVSKKGKYIALEYVHDDAKAEDILQETFIKAFSSLDQLKDPDKFEPWFFTILNRLAINATNQKMIDKNSTNFSAYDSEDMNYEDSLTKDYVEFQPEENFDYSELKQGIQNIMEELPEAQRMAVYAYFFEGLNMREIADLYDVGESTIRARINAAKTKMHDMIKSLEAKGMPLFGAAPASVFQWYANGEASHIATKVQFKRVFKRSRRKSNRININRKNRILDRMPKIKYMLVFPVIVVVGMFYINFESSTKNNEIGHINKGLITQNNLVTKREKKEKQDKSSSPESTFLEPNLDYNDGLYAQDGVMDNKKEDVNIYENVEIYPKETIASDAPVAEANQACTDYDFEGFLSPGDIECY